MVMVIVMLVFVYVWLLAYVSVKAFFHEEDIRRIGLHARRQAHNAEVREGWLISKL